MTLLGNILIFLIISILLGGCDISDRVADNSSQKPTYQENFGAGKGSWLEVRRPSDNSCFDGAEQAKAGNYQKAMEIWERNALEQTPKERARADMTCMKVSGLVKNDVELASWILARAESNIPSAQLYAGMLFSTGLGVEKDFNKAKFWISQAKKNNNPDALGFLKAIEEAESKETKTR